MTKRLVIHGGNPVYGYKGTLYHRTDNLGATVVHEVEDEVAENLTADADSPWREVDEDGNVIPSEADLAAEDETRASEEARTFKVPVTPAVSDKDDGKGKKTITIQSKAPAKAAEAAKQEASETDTENAVEV